MALDRKFGTDMIWNLASLAFLALAGLALNLIIARVYGAKYLGVFNIVLALYVFFSQFAVFGLHMSVLRYVSEHMANNKVREAEIVSEGLVAVTLVALAVTFAGWLLSPLVEAAYKSAHVVTAWYIILPGLAASALNKYLLAVINGARHMRAFAIFQSLRYIFIFLILLFMILTQQPGAYLSAVISGAEFVLLPLLLVYTMGGGRIVRTWRISPGWRWAWRHLHFGSRVFLSGTISELNYRVDILMIGAFLGERQAGIYSIAIFIIEGLARVTFVVRNNVNPLLTPYVLQGRLEELTRFARRVSLYFTLFMAFAGGVLIALYPWFASLVFPGREFDAAYAPLIVLIIGQVLAAPYLPFNMILSQADHPGMHTLYMFGVLCSNVAFNLVAIPKAGITGAAFATAMSYLFSVLLLVLMARRLLGVKVWV